ncbi:molybdenum cofactor sulfurylase [Pluralibacter gergoviae]|uniref:xanthine dehydrogenase accessory protein XdhC n=1 Tax=Pluralibacter gergoviae TaxID=61647 RepID=UPI000650EDD0|nr:xanthine dehydrogenase accessory protein XdhC [Pluralibacter gergoviae]KMK19676.1 molybdenum cofactor sulfurylase [Pluralibacter gergoviae]
MRDDEWLDVLLRLRERQVPAVILTLMEDRGSVPRGAGTKMVVAENEVWLTIGGGNLEFQCTAIAREMLASGAQQPREEKFALGARAGQCCGGMTRVLFEPWGRPLPAVYVFGAGHVGRALVTLLATLPCRVFWVDEREDYLRDAPPGVRCLHADDPCDIARRAPDGSLFVVMTHSHPLDLALADALLRREGVRYLGVIGSQTKRQRFDYLLEGKGIPAAKLATMRCPVGLPDVKGKLPAEIAVAVAGEIIAVYQSGK